MEEAGGSGGGSISGRESIMHGVKGLERILLEIIPELGNRSTYLHAFHIHSSIGVFQVQLV